MDGWYGDDREETVEAVLIRVYYDRNFGDVYVYGCIYLKHYVQVRVICVNTLGVYW